MKRRLQAIANWLEHRTGINTIMRRALYEEIPGSSGWRQVFGSVAAFLFMVQFFTGVLLWDVTRFSSIVETFGGVRVVDTVHVLLFILFSGFIIVHVYLASLGHTPSAHFKAMITGYEEIEEEP